MLPQQQKLVDYTNEHVFMWKIPEIGGRQSMMFNYINTYNQYLLEWYHVINIKWLYTM